jgi:hypothetical protein
MKKSSLCVEREQAEVKGAPKEQPDFSQITRPTTPEEQAIICRFEDFKRKNAGKIRRVEVGHVTVDTATVVIIDPCHINDGRPLPSGFMNSSEGLVDPTTGQIKENQQDEIEEATMGIDPTTGEASGAGSIYHGSAVASSTGYGDGTYPVYATIKDGRVLKLEVVFA